MGNINNFAKLALGASMGFLIWGGLQLHQRGHGVPAIDSDWNLISNYHAVGGVRSNPAGKDLDLSDRELVLKRQSIQDQAATLAKNNEESEEAETAEPETKEAKSDKKKKQKKKVAKPAKKKRPQQKSPDERDEQETVTAENQTPSRPAIARAHRAYGSPANGGLPGEAEWRRNLFAAPNAVLTGEFIQAYATGVVSKEVFYLLVEEMILDSREELQEMGRRALDATPSYDSFRLLAYYETVSQEPMRSRFFNSLDVYASKDHLGILETALDSEDEAAQVHAAKLIHVAVQQIKDSLLSAPSSERSVRGFRSLAEADDYERLIPILRDLSRSANPSLSSSAYDALNELNRIINS